jgi:hypothetical protein
VSHVQAPINRESTGLLHASSVDARALRAAVMVVIAAI